VANENAWGMNTPTLNPGQTLPYSNDGDLPLQSPYGNPPTSTSQQFLNPSLVAPYYNAAGVAGNLGTLTGQNAQAANQFQAGLWNPNLNNFEQSFLQAGLGNNQVLLNQMMAQQNAQYQDTPFHSSLARSQNDLMAQMGRDTLSQAAQMGMQREGIGAQMSTFPFQYTQQAANVGADMSERMFNMYNQQFNNPFQVPLAYYAQSPMLTPSIIPQGQSGKV